MARETVVSMRVISAVIAVAEGAVVNVSQVCRDAGVSRKTFYEYLARYRAGGIAGIEPRSRRPHHSPGQTPAEVEDAVVTLRKELVDAEGTDAIDRRLAQIGEQVFQTCSFSST